MVCRLTTALLLFLLVPSAFAAEAAAPISLSDPDGQELLLEELSVRTAVHGMLALTEVEMRFRNPRDEVAEGRFSCVLPAGATISRFAKEVNGVLMEGEIVERMRANRIYDEILHQMRDPALLEQDLGNRFSARVFPIEPRGLVRLVLSYTELVPAIDGVRAHIVPLRGLPRVARFSFHAILVPLPGEGDAEVTGLTGTRSMMASRVVSFTESDWVPDDIELDRLAASPGLRLLRAGDFYLASYIPPPAPAARSSARTSWLIYLDTSASSAAGALHRIAALEELLASLPPGDSVEIVAFDQTIARLFEGSAGEASRRIASLVRERKNLGGTDIGAAIADLVKRARDRRVLFVSDGVATQGTVELHDLRAAAAKIPAGLTLHAVVLGSVQNAETLRALTRGHGRIVTVPFTESMKLRAREAASLLQLPPGESVAVRDAAAEWIYPAVLEDVRGGR
ncbi:MAG TPA: VIT and VWA domain-containing protein, partial [Thermoanaerobaculia bacterium]